jgi:hypothetical protein
VTRFSSLEAVYDNFMSIFFCAPYQQINTRDAVLTVILMDVFFRTVDKLLETLSISHPQLFEWAKTVNGKIKGK